jgi:hypothetical protein
MERHPAMWPSAPGDKGQERSRKVARNKDEECEFRLDHRMPRHAFQKDAAIFLTNGTTRPTWS